MHILTEKKNYSGIWYKFSSHVTNWASGLFFSWIQYAGKFICGQYHLSE